MQANHSPATSAVAVLATVAPAPTPTADVTGRRGTSTTSSSRRGSSSDDDSVALLSGDAADFDAALAALDLPVDAAHAEAPTEAGSSAPRDEADDAAAAEHANALEAEVASDVTQPLGARPPSAAAAEAADVAAAAVAPTALASEDLTAALRACATVAEAVAALQARGDAVSAPEAATALHKIAFLASSTPRKGAPCRTAQRGHLVDTRPCVWASAALRGEVQGMAIMWFCTKHIPPAHQPEVALPYRQFARAEMSAVYKSSTWRGLLANLTPSATQLHPEQLAACFWALATTRQCVEPLVDALARAWAEKQLAAGKGTLLGHAQVLWALGTLRYLPKVCPFKVISLCVLCATRMQIMIHYAGLQACRCVEYAQQAAPSKRWLAEPETRL